MADLLDPLFWGSSFFVPNVGWVIYSGANSCLKTMQILSRIDGTWKVGPQLYLNQSRSYQCGVQVSF